MLRKPIVFLISGLTLFGIFFAQDLYASFQFEFSVRDYAKEGWYYYPLLFKVDIENTGTEADTIDLDLARDIPGGWYADLCVRGKCFQDHAEIDLLPGQRDSILVDIYLGGARDVGSVTLTGTMRSDTLEAHSVTLVGFCAQPSILVVDDDNGASYESYLEAAIDSAGYKMWIWDAYSSGRPGSLQLCSYWSVFWTTANGDASYITGSDEGDWATFLDGGGNLFLASMNYLSSRTLSSFMTDYLHIDSWTSDVGASSVSGIGGDPVSDGMSLALGTTPFSASQTDVFSDNSPSETIFTSPSGNVGLKVAEGSHKIVFLSFPFEAIVNSPYPDNQQTLISRVIDWFGPYEASIGARDVDNKSWKLRNFPNPFRNQTTISLGGKRRGHELRLRIYDVKGSVVRTLVGQASADNVVWDGRDDDGRRVPPGIYFVNFETNGQTMLHKMVLAR